jgi:hypothetical protein
MGAIQAHGGKRGRIASRPWEGSLRVVRRKKAPLSGPFPFLPQFENRLETDAPSLVQAPNTPGFSRVRGAQHRNLSNSSLQVRS